MKFDESKAMKSGAGNTVTKGGVYDFTIKRCEYRENNNGVKYFEFDFDTNEGDLKYVRVYATKRNGEEHFQVYHIHSLMGLCRIDELKLSNNVVKNLIGCTGRVAVMRREYRKNDGSIGFNMELMSFFGKDGKTYTEMKNGSDAFTIKRPIEDELITEDDVPDAYNVSKYDVPPEDDLPF